MPKNHLSPHDRYIRSILSNAPVAREFFEKHLSAEVLNAIDFSSLKPEKDSFVNDKLRLKVADLLFSVNFNGDPGYIYLLLEHTSKPDRFLPYRMLHYTLGIMDQHLKKWESQKVRNKKLPLIVPLILYTGQKPYTYSTDLFELFGAEKELAKSTFLSPFQLVDLNKIPDEILREAYYWFGAAALTAKHIRDFNLVSLVKNVVDLLEKLKENGLNSYVYLTLSYMFAEGEIQDEEAFREIIRSGLSSNDEEIVMTLAEKYRQKGYEEAMVLAEQRLHQEAMILAEQRLHQEAMILAEQYRQDKLETVLNLLKFGMSVEQVSQATKLPVQEVQSLWHQNTSKH